MIQQAATTPFDERFLVLAPTGRDATLTCAMLAKAGLACDGCSTMAELIHRAEHEGAAGLLVADEALGTSAFTQLVALINRQEAWSDIPILLFGGQGATVQTRTPTAQLLAPLGNVTLLERPLRPMTMISAAKAAARARHRQYQARDELVEQQRAVQQRDQFLAMLGHELRNPLGAIVMAAEMMNRSEAHAPRYRAVVERQARHLSRLVDDLLDVSRVTSGKIVLQCERLDVTVLIQRCMQTMDSAINEQQLTISLSRPALPLFVDADQVRFEQVVVNLLANAIKYTPANGHIEVSTSCDGDDVVVRFSDSGVGIAADMVDRVFDLFSQVEGTLDRAQGGMGIGLTLVRSLVELHGGTVTAASPGLGKGSVFTVRLPRAATTSTASERPAGEGEPGARHDVLVVEDNPDSREMLCSLLESSGHRVAAVGDGLTAVQCALEMRPSIIVVDIGLPGLDGYGVAERVRDSLGATVFLVALTGYGQPEDQRRALAAGFDVHLTKPVDFEALQRLIEGAHAG